MLASAAAEADDFEREMWVFVCLFVRVCVYGKHCPCPGVFPCVDVRVLFLETPLKKKKTPRTTAILPEVHQHPREAPLISHVRSRHA